MPTAQLNRWRPRVHERRFHCLFWNFALSFVARLSKPRTCQLPSSGRKSGNSSGRGSRLPCRKPITQTLRNFDRVPHRSRISLSSSAIYRIAAFAGRVRPAFTSSMLRSRSERLWARSAWSISSSNADGERTTASVSPLVVTNSGRLVALRSFR